MTIEEASQLVLQTLSLAKGGDVFLLDMGEPLKIRDLAENMIRLSGLTVKNDYNLDGDIEIVTTGLRPGEKLYEETLIEGNSESTDHPLIYKGNEVFIEPEILWNYLKILEKELNKLNKESVYKLLKEIIPEWNQYES